GSPQVRYATRPGLLVNSKDIGAPARVRKVLARQDSLQVFVLFCQSWYTELSSERIRSLFPVVGILGALTALRSLVPTILSSKHLGPFDRLQIAVKGGRRDPARLHVAASDCCYPEDVRHEV